MLGERWLRARLECAHTALALFPAPYGGALLSVLCPLLALSGAFSC
jgi:hypothetical protein